MKLVHTGDWHIGKFLNEFSLLEDQEYFLNGLIELLQTENADGLIIAGDIYDRSVPPAEAVALVDRVFSKIIRELKIPIFAISGNHDSSQRLAFANDLYRQSGLYLESIYDGELAKYNLNDEFGEVSLYLLPFVTPAMTKNILKNDDIKTCDDAFKAIINSEKVDYSKRNILITHGFFGFSGASDDVFDDDSTSDEKVLSESESSVGGTEICDIKIAKDFDYIALGHLHSPQKCGMNHIRYSGSLLKYSISEFNQKKTVAVISFNEKGNINIDQKAIKPLRDLVCIEGKISELIENKNNISINDYIFATLTDDGVVLDAMSKLRSVFKNVLGLRMKEFDKENYQNTNSSENIKSRSELELFSDFYNEMSGEELVGKRLEIMEDIIKQAKLSEIL